MRNEDQQWVQSRIQTAINEHLNPHGWQKLIYWLRLMGPLAATISLIVALLTLAATAFYQATARIGRQATFETNTERDLKEIRGDIAGIRGDLAKLSLAAAVALPSAQFRATLPDIHSSITIAKQQNFKVPVTIVEDIAHKMVATDTNAPAFWPTAAAIISYQSSLLVGGSRNWSVTIPACRGPADLDASPEASIQKVTPEGKAIGPKVPIARLGDQDCYVELDGKNASRWDCTRCLVKYSGGPLSIRDVNFKDCLFVFDFGVKQSPTPDGQRLSEILLASGLRNVKIPAG